MKDFNARRVASRLSQILLFCLGLSACGDAKDLLDLALDPPSRETIDVSRVGVNNFFVDQSSFGPIDAQYREIRDTLGLRYIRVLLAWTDAVQPSPNSTPDFGFYDAILNDIPPGVDVLVVVTHAPAWMTDPSNWISGSARFTWVQRWLRPVVERYGDRGGIVGFEIWNEPNVTTLPGDGALELTNPDNYFDLLTFASQTQRAIAPGKLVVIAATTAIQQNFPTTLRYNQRLRDLGAEGLVDVWNIHYYGTSYESVVTSNGVADFLNGLSLPIWLTESGEDGPNDQLAYAETAWPFLIDEVPGIQRIYYYQYGETVQPVERNFGLRTTDPAFPVSDLYVHLRERAGGG